MLKSWFINAIVFLAFGLVAGGALALDNDDVVEFWRHFFGV